MISDMVTFNNTNYNFFKESFNLESLCIQNNWQLYIKKNLLHLFFLKQKSFVKLFFYFPNPEIDDIDKKINLNSKKKSSLLKKIFKLKPGYWPIIRGWRVIVIKEFRLRFYRQASVTNWISRTGLFSFFSNYLFSYFGYRLLCSINFVYNWKYSV